MHFKYVGILPETFLKQREAYGQKRIFVYYDLKMELVYSFGKTASIL